MQLPLCLLLSTLVAAAAAAGAQTDDLAAPMAGGPQKRDVSGAERSAFGMETVAYPVMKHNEPSCEQLRAMWRASKRQSRAAEMTNEIPKLRDPFVYPFHAYSRYFPYGQQSFASPKMNSRFGVRRPFPFFPARQHDMGYGGLTPEPAESGKFGDDMLDLSSKISGSQGRYPMASSAGSFNILRDLVTQEKLQEQLAMEMLQRRLGITPSPLDDDVKASNNRNNNNNNGGGVFGRIFYSPEAAQKYRDEVRTSGSLSLPDDSGNSNVDVDENHGPSPPSNNGDQPSASDVNNARNQHSAREHYRRPRLNQPTMAQCHLSKGRSCYKDDDCLCAHKYACFSGTCMRKNVIRSVERSWNQQRGQDDNSSSSMQDMEA